jgi:amino-acid N-acetyltransferase
MNKPDLTFKIRPAQLEDQKIIHNLLSGFKLPLDGLDETKLWVLQSSIRDVLGVAGLETFGSQGLLRSVAVSKNLQGQDYGTLLVNHVISEAKKSSIQDLFLLTTTAPSFFEKIGFKKENRDKVTGDIVESIEFKSACPKTAVLMHATLSNWSPTTSNEKMPKSNQVF